MLSGICNQCACVVAPHASICARCVCGLSSDELLKHLIAETKASRHAQLPIILDPPTAIALIGMLQLALRHPGTQGRPTAQIAQNVIAGMQGMFAELHLAAHVETISRGGQAEHDVIEGSVPDEKQHTPAEES